MNDGQENTELVCAAVVPVPGRVLAEQTIKDWVRHERGASYTPHVVLVLEQLPATGSQKPDRAALRHLIRSAQNSVQP